MTTNYANLFSELLMCSTTLGAGIAPPFDELYEQAGMMFVSAVSDEFKTKMRRATVEFNRDAIAEEAQLQHRVRQLEGQLAIDTPGAYVQLEEAREQLKSENYPYCHDHSATKDLVLDLVKKSRYKHVAVMDDQGFRLSMSLTYNPMFGRESSLLPMTAGYMMDHASFRVHGTGATKNDYIVAGKSAAFTYFSSPAPDLSEKLMHKLHKSKTLSALRGHAVIIPNPPLVRASIHTTPEGLVKLLNTYYVLGHKAEKEKASFVLESSALEASWRQFLTAHDWLEVLEIPDNRLQSADKAISKYHIKPKVAAAFATRAAMCQAVIDNGGDPMKIPLTKAHMHLAIEFFKVLFEPFKAQLKTADKQADNAAKARAARSVSIPSPARQEAAMDVIREEIQKAERNLLPRSTAVRLPKVTTALLDYLIANNSELVELVGIHQIKMGKTSRAYTLRTLVSRDIDEAKDDLAEAQAAYAEDPHAPVFDDIHVVRHEIMRLAAESEKGEFGLPAVPITKMSPQQIKCLPAILKEFDDCFVMRGTPESPEMPHLVKSVTDPTAPLDPDVPVVWVRRTIEGRDFRNWGIAIRLGFSETWTT